MSFQNGGLLLAQSVSYIYIVLVQDVSHFIKYVKTTRPQVPFVYYYIPADTRC